MVRQGSTEYVTGGTDPDQLFDLALDPEERVNLADSASHQSVMADSAALAAIQWNPETLDQDIRSSQRRRLFLRNLGSGDLSYPPHLILPTVEFSEKAHNSTSGFTAPRSDLLPE